VNSEYLYQDFNGLDWDAIRNEYLQRIESGIIDEEFYLSMDEMISRLKDEHSTYFNPDQAKQEDQQYAGDYNYVGIGVLTTPVYDRNVITILTVFPDSPAKEANLQVRDSIIAVDGQPIINNGIVQHELLRGLEGSELTITVQTPGEEPREVRLIRRRITGSLDVPHQILTSSGGKSIGYILLVTFGDSTIDDQVGDALREMFASSPLDGLIIDNRMNNGGASDVLEGTLAYFTDGKVGYFVNRQQEEPLLIDGEDINGSQNLPLVVLTGPETASFGEIFAGILQDINRAYIIGEVTAGNVEILYIYNFEDGSRVWLAHDTFKPLNQPEKNWELTGITPDLIISTQWDLHSLEADPTVLEALTYFDKK